MIKKEVKDGTLRVEDEKEGIWIEGKAKMSYGFKRKMSNIQRPSKMRYKGDDDIIMYMDDYNVNEDMDLLILENQLTDWSEKGKPSMRKIMDDTKLGALFDEFLDKVKEINNLLKVGKEKKQKENKE